MFYLTLSLLDALAEVSNSEFYSHLLICTDDSVL